MMQSLTPESRTENLHGDFELAFRNRIGEVLSRAEIREVLEDTFGNFPTGSVVPTDHAEPSPGHVNQCQKCADPDYQIFDTVIAGNGKSGVARYLVRHFKTLSAKSHSDGQNKT